MPQQIHRMGDPNSGGGIISFTPQSSVFVNGLLVCVVGSNGTSHPPCPKPAIHCQGAWVTTMGSSTVFIEGIPVNKMGDTDTCSHIRTSGSPDVFVE